MKKLALSLLLICCMTAALFGCSGNKVVHDSNVLIIEALDAGYGTSWLDRLEEIFEAEHEGKSVEIKYSKTVGATVQNKITSGYDKNNTGLFITDYNNFRNLIDMGSRAIKGNANGESFALASLDDVYATELDGTTAFNKLRPDYQNYISHQGTKWVVPWANGPCGLMINQTLMDHFGWSTPKTMSEMIALCDAVAALRQNGGMHACSDADGAQKPCGKDLYPITYPGINSGVYWEYVYDAWHAQYEGMDNYTRFFGGKGLNDYTGEYTYSDGYKNYDQDGRLESLKALESLIGTNKYVLEGSTTASHTEAQESMLYGKALMVPSGDWIENEMLGTDYKCLNVEGQPSTDIAYLPTPVLDVVDSWKKYETDQEGTDPETGVAKSELYQRYLDANKYAFNLGYALLAMIPSYASSINLAKDFLRMMISDRGCDIFLEEAGSPSPFKTQHTEQEIEGLQLTEFQKSKVEFNKTAIYVTNDLTSPLRYKANIANYNKNQPYEKIPAGMKAKDLHDAEFKYAQQMWSSWLNSGGVTI